MSLKTVILLFCLSAHNAEGGSIWWEYWPDSAGCNETQGEVHSDWTLDGECVQSSLLKADDPIKYIGNGTDVRLRCVDPDGGSSNNLAKDDDAVLAWFNTTDGSCGGQPWLVINISSSECGPPPAHALRAHCTRCKWFFREAPSPPYFLQAIGVLIFLTACIIFNLLFQQKLDHCSKVLPPKICGCLFAEDQEDPSRSISAGSLVEIAENSSMFTAIDLVESPKAQPPVTPLTKGSIASEESNGFGGSLKIPSTPLGMSLGAVSLGKTHSGSQLVLQAPPGRAKRNTRRASRYRTEGAESPSPSTSPTSSKWRSNKRVSRCNTEPNPLLATPLLRSGNGVEEHYLVHTGVQEEEDPFAPMYNVEPRVIVSDCKSCGCPVAEHDCDEWVQRANDGEFGRVAQVTRVTPTRTHVSFLRPRVELSAGDPDPLWQGLTDSQGFVVVREEGPEGPRLVELDGNINVWMDSSNLLWRSNCTNYVRVIEEPWLKADSHWKDWYKDFELCVGKVIACTKTEDGEILLRVSFMDSAKLTLPLACFRPSNEENHNSECLMVPQPMERRIMMAVFVASTPPLLSLKAIFLVVLFGLAIYNVLQEGHRGRAAHHNSWEGYEEVYFKLFNSGYPSLMADCSTLTSYFLINFRPSRKGFVRGIGLPSTVVLVLTTVVSLPGIVTHALPMAFYYGWMWIPLFFIVHHGAKVIIRYRPAPPVMDMDDAFSMKAIWKHHRTYVIKTSTYYLFFRFIAEIIGVIFLQTNYNYGVLVYDGSPYFKTIKTEFEQREFLCIWEMGVQTASLLW
eukprot:TRINITY_DN9788_c0_g1_i1.p1 TRINITY_DN9788_c0_g1~~TRINITY_DN9788_c0_g1_i1.p1  ORF type:complete len:792 (+),score=86.38 TRINITY_DN9788_c0_g1_i1:52-2427(+)